jgi:hypothetical protein
MEAYSAPVGYVFSLNAGGRSGVFDVVAGDFSAKLAADTLNGIYVGLSDDLTATTKVAKRRTEIARPEWFGAIADGVANDTVEIQAAIDISDYVYLTGTYRAANILIKSGLFLIGDGSTSIKLLDNAMLASYNGSTVDADGNYAGNILCSVLNEDGGVFYDAGVRALDPNNSTYIYEDVYISGITFDGNKANNQIGESGQNSSAMGAGVSLFLVKNVTVDNCKLINNRLEGVFIGYTLTGGSDYCTVKNCWFEGNQRNNIAITTGKYNSIINNKGTKTTGGTSVFGISGLDIEPNFADEVCFRHIVTGNALGDNLKLVSPQKAIMSDTTISNNIWVGGVTIDAPSANGRGTTGLVISGDVFNAEVLGEGGWLTVNGVQPTETTQPPIIIIGCTVRGFDKVMGTIVQGSQNGFTVKDCNFETNSFGPIFVGYKVTIEGNKFQFSGNADPETITLINNFGATLPNQGGIVFSRNTFNGQSNSVFLRYNKDVSWPINFNDVIFDNNELYLSGSTTIVEGLEGFSFTNNKVDKFAPFGIQGNQVNTIISGNFLSSGVSTNMFSGQNAKFSDSEINGNALINVSINLQRPLDVVISENRIIEGDILITYEFTSVGIGRNHIVHNALTSKTGIATPFSVTTGNGFDAADFVGNDQYKYNTFVGYAGAPSISAAVSSDSDGTFG